MNEDSFKGIFASENVAWTSKCQFTSREIKDIREGSDGCNR